LLGGDVVDLNALCKKTRKNVKQAAKIVLKGATTTLEKDGAANIVTDADLNVQTFLKEKLHKLLPQAGFLCEEGDFIPEEKEYMWVIDPIDGTTNFARNIPEHGISVGLLYKNQPVLGVVYCPRLNLMFHATKGGGAFVGRKRISVSDKPFKASLLCTALCLYKKELAHICSSIISDTFPLCSDIRRFGSCALELCFLAMGRCDLYFEIRVFPWDFAGAYVILTEAGGILKGYNGSEPCLNKPTMLVGANNKENFNKLNSIVMKHIKQPLGLED
jgi:myo-inositol-1(or 4)-monophosphatase